MPSTHPSTSVASPLPTGERVSGHPSLPSWKGVGDGYNSIGSLHYILCPGRADVTLSTHAHTHTALSHRPSSFSGEDGRWIRAAKSESPWQGLTCCRVLLPLRGMGWANKQGNRIHFRVFMFYSSLSIFFVKYLGSLCLLFYLSSCCFCSANLWLLHFYQQE